MGSVAAEGARVDIQSQSHHMQAELHQQTLRLDELRAHIDESIPRLSKSVAGLSGRAEKEEARRESNFSSLHRQLSRELRAEAADAIRKEASSVAALDEQLWLTDQRL